MTRICYIHIRQYINHDKLTIIHLAGVPWCLLIYERETSNLDFSWTIIRIFFKRQICLCLWNRIFYPPWESWTTETIKESFLYSSKQAELPGKAIMMICGFPKRPCDSDMEHKWCIASVGCRCPSLNTTTSANSARLTPLPGCDFSVSFRQLSFPVIPSWLWELQPLFNVPLSGGYCCQRITI